MLQNSPDPAKFLTKNTQNKLIAEWQITGHGCPHQNGSDHEKRRDCKVEKIQHANDQRKRYGDHDVYAAKHQAIHDLLENEHILFIYLKAGFTK